MMSPTAPLATDNTAPSLSLLLESLAEMRRTTAALIDAYYQRLALDPPDGVRLCRWQVRTLSALRASGKVIVKTDRSIMKVKRRMAGDP